MTELRKHIMRVVLVFLLFQFVAPAFFATVAPGSEPVQNNSYHTPHASLILPLLLKEKDETEDKSEDLQIVYVPLFDLSDHISVLRASHKTSVEPISTSNHFDNHPPLFTLYSVFLI